MSLSTYLSGCTCAQGSCTTTEVSGYQCYECTYSQGFSGWPGGNNIMTVTANYAGTLLVFARLTGGNPPSNFSVSVNGQSVGQIQGSGGSTFVNVNSGDQVSIGDGWGWFYYGGTFSVGTCVPIISTSTPTPTSSTPNKLLILALIVMVVMALIAIIVLRLRNRVGTYAK